MTVNYLAPLFLIKRFLEVYQELDLNKTIINVSSGASTSAYASWANYCSSKAALEMLTKCINEEQKEKIYPIKCFSIAPGVVDTNMQIQIRNTPEKDFKLQSKFIDLFNEKKLFNPNYVAQKLLEVIEFPNQFDSVFRIL
jgi:benzil reductase ((S)-benzoin forming)